MEPGNGFGVRGRRGIQFQIAGRGYPSSKRATRADAPGSPEREDTRISVPMSSRRGQTAFTTDVVGMDGFAPLIFMGNHLLRVSVLA